MAALQRGERASLSRLNHNVAAICITEDDPNGGACRD